MALAFSSSRSGNFCQAVREARLVEGEWKAPGSGQWLAGAWQMELGRWGRAERCHKAPTLALAPAPDLAPSPALALPPAPEHCPGPVLSTGGSTVLSSKPLTLEGTLRGCSVASKGQQGS